MNDQEINRITDEMSAALEALGEHPDSPVNLADRIREIRDEGRTHFHQLTKLQSELEQSQADVIRWREFNEVGAYTNEITRLRAELDLAQRNLKTQVEMYNVQTQMRASAEAERDALTRQMATITSFIQESAAGDTKEVSSSGLAAFQPEKRY